MVDVINAHFMLDSSRSDTAKAVEILRNIRPFKAVNKEVFAEMCRLLSLDNFRFCQRKWICGNSNFTSDIACLIIWGQFGRERERLKDLGDMNSMRQETCREIVKLIKANPVLNNKLKFPEMEPSESACNDWPQVLFVAFLFSHALWISICC